MDATAGLIGNAVQPIDVGGVTIPAGATIVVALGATSRDSKHFDLADRYRPDRVTPTLTFGSGPRPCPGAAHAIAIAVGVFESLRKLDVTDVVDVTDVRYEPRPNLRIPATLQVTVDIGARGRALGYRSR